MTLQSILQRTLKSIRNIHILTLPLYHETAFLLSQTGSIQFALVTFPPTLRLNVFIKVVKLEVLVRRFQLGNIFTDDRKFTGKYAGGNLKYGEAARNVKTRGESCYDILKSLKIHYNESIRCFRWRGANFEVKILMFLLIVSVLWDYDSWWREDHFSDFTWFIQISNFIQSLNNSRLISKL